MLGATTSHPPVPRSTMAFENSSFRSPVDDIALTTYAWNGAAEPRGVIQIAHGLAEHAARYDCLATALNAAGYLVRATDHRGHDQSTTDVPGALAASGSAGLIDDVAANGSTWPARKTVVRGTRWTIGGKVGW